MRTLSLLLALMFLVPASAAAQEVTLKEQMAEAKALREAIKALPQDDSAVAYARSLKLEGTLFVAGGAALGGAGMASVFIEIAANPQDTVSVAPALFGASLGVGLGLVAIGVPNLLDGGSFLKWYATHDRPPSSLARLKLLRRWRMVNLRSRMLSGVIGGGTMGAIGLVSGIVWAINDSRGQNRSSLGYDATDAMVSLGFIAGAVGAGAVGLVAGLEFDQQKKNPHRLYAPIQAVPTVGVAPLARGEGMAMSFGVVGVF